MRFAGVVADALEFCIAVHGGVECGVVEVIWPAVGLEEEF